MRELLTRVAGAVLRTALLAEARCPCCGKVRAGGMAELCAECREDGAAAEAEQRGEPCPGCGEYPPVPQDVSLLCGCCRETPRPWGRVLAYGPYAGRLKQLILGYKFENRLDFGRSLQECLLEAYERGVAACPELGQGAVLVPVPLHPRRLLMRGFNQSREIARLLSARHGLPIRQDALSRVRRTTPQMRLAREARAENIRGAFAARSQVLEGQAVLLVDDIMTTGATLEECARAMLAAGAKRVDVLVLARA
ncbi:MAG TPA: ComF family protein [Humidesulfovibrio sp.]|uniref:ComF family protein n=1 Tax=Humidesulfovibrio sp. TaxID=2910988 RepID=UPI002CC145C2|nr:ComF family protein [Humidesulfovibrio sp.]HWR04634.1 ComF family protein [Humidesulfovibrio sp.]